MVQACGRASSTFYICALRIVCPSPSSYLCLRTFCPRVLSISHITMLARFAPRALSAPVRRAAFQPLRAAPIARRSVTTDAAASHVNKEDVPEVGDSRESSPDLGCTVQKLTFTSASGGRQAFPSQAIRRELRDVRTRPTFIHPRHHKGGAEANVLRHGSSPVRWQK